MPRSLPKGAPGAHLFENRRMCKNCCVARFRKQTADENYAHAMSCQQRLRGKPEARAEMQWASVKQLPVEYLRITNAY